MDQYKMHVRLDFVAYNVIYKRKCNRIKKPLQSHSRALLFKQLDLPRILRKRLIYRFIYILTQRHKTS